LDSAGVIAAFHDDMRQDFVILEIIRLDLDRLLDLGLRSVEIPAFH
jgi:hypothetical protein